MPHTPEPIKWLQSIEDIRMVEAIVNLIVSREYNATQIKVMLNERAVEILSKSVALNGSGHAA